MAGRRGSPCIRMAWRGSRQVTRGAAAACKHGKQNAGRRSKMADRKQPCSEEAVCSRHAHLFEYWRQRLALTIDNDRVLACGPGLTVVALKEKITPCHHVLHPLLRFIEGRKWL